MRRRGCGHCCGVRSVSKEWHKPCTSEPLAICEQLQRGSSQLNMQAQPRPCTRTFTTLLLGEGMVSRSGRR